MSFIEGLPDDLVQREILPKLMVPTLRQRLCIADKAALVEVLNRLRRCWATSAIWKRTIEATVEWAAWRLARWEAGQYDENFNAPGYSLLGVDPRHPPFGRLNAVDNFRTNVSAFIRSKAISVHCKRHPKLSVRELQAPLQALSVAELYRLRNVLRYSVRANNKDSAGQTWVTPRDRLD